MAFKQIQTNLQERLKDGSILMLLAAALAFGAVHSSARSEATEPIAKIDRAPVAAAGTLVPELLPR